MADLPAELPFGKVVARLILAVADSSDTGRLPDATPAVGTVFFTPSSAIIKTQLPTPATVVKQPIECGIDADGFLIDPEGDLGVWLVAGVYNVRYKIPLASVPTHDIEVLATHDDATPLDLTNAMPPGGPILSATQYAELSARIDTIETDRTLDPGRYAPLGLPTLGRLSPQQAFTNRVKARRPSTFVVMGDSTGNDTGEWPSLLTNYFATNFPSHTVTYRLWRDALLGYRQADVRQVGSDGPGYLSPAVGGVQTPDSARVSLTNCDVTLTCRVRFTDVDSGEKRVIASHWGGGTDRSWYVYVNSAGLNLAYSTEGADLVDVLLATPAQLAAVGVVDGVDVHIGVRIVRDSGGTALLQALHSPDGGVTWNVVGTPSTENPAITSLFDSTAPVQVGTRNNTVTPFSGRIYWVQVVKGTGIDNAVAFRFDASAWSNGTSFTDPDGLVWTLTGSSTFTAAAPLLTVLNGSHPGAAIDYGTTNLATLLPGVPNLALLNYGHNQDKTQAEFEAFVDAVQASKPNVGVAVNLQNPTGALSTTYVRQNRQMADLAELAARQGYGVIDAFGAFIASGDPDSLVEATGSYVHPIAAGSNLWGEVAAQTFGLGV